MKAPTNLICAGESKEVTLSYAGQNVEVAVGDLTFVNDRQKAKVFAEKQDSQEQYLDCMQAKTSRTRTDRLWLQKIP